MRLLAPGFWLLPFLFALTSCSATPYAPTSGGRLRHLVGGALPNHPPQNLTIATTGASGSVFLRQLLLAVERDARVQTVNFIASDSGLRVLAEELGIEGRSQLVRQILSGRGASASEKDHEKARPRPQPARTVRRKFKSNRMLTSGPTWLVVLTSPTP